MKIDGVQSSNSIAESAGIEVRLNSPDAENEVCRLNALTNTNVRSITGVYTTKIRECLVDCTDTHWCHEGGEIGFYYKIVDLFKDLNCLLECSSKLLGSIRYILDVL